ncbi:hypothetical protein HH310_21805 [Actinoplanes sp. TBRC 11911]|uniref:hypothetical protein n=1 Tax=Actinoplanes sp. TBRC 11911 TaxID=2729386 RepID=UPI00145F1BD0|nr:hypothetical protein [Actinoplanes sp. TBRC 11911]NMO53806.1 hypothetical protein [Actinoplanes sp. TBRC 11911]
MRHRGPTVLAAAIVLIGAVAACAGPTSSTGPDSGPAAPAAPIVAVPAPPAASGPAASASPTGPASPAHTGPASPASSPRTAGGGTTGPRASVGWDDVDLGKVMFKVMNCPDQPEAHGRAESRGHKMADLTGDGVADLIQAASCFTTTAANANNIAVFDGRHPSATPKTLLVIGRDAYLQGDVQITTSGRTVTVVSNALSKKAARCCPDLKITQAYTWTGDHFTRTKYKEEPGPCTQDVCA